MLFGGGVHNPLLMARIAALLPGMRIESTATCGLDPDYVEAMAFAWLARETLAGRPGNLPAVGECAPLLDEMEAVSDEWLEAKSGEEKGFSLGSFERSYLLRFPIALAEHEGRIVAFANLWTAPAGKELSVDLMRHRNDAPKGTMDYLFTGLFLWGQSQGYSRFSLGMAPLSGLAQHRLAGRWNRFANIVVRHGERFYGFSGLRKFKAKFLPVWRTRYFAAPGGMHLPTALIDVTRLISVDPRRHE